MALRPAKTQISLGIHPVWSESSLSAWRKVGSLATHWTHSEGSDQTGRMPRLIWVFVGSIATLLVLSQGGSKYPMFSEWQVWVNNVDPDQTAQGAVWSRSTLFAIPSASFGYITVTFRSFRTDRSWSSLIRVYTVCNPLCIFWMHYSKETPSCSTFRVITINFRVS